MKKRLIVGLGNVGVQYLSTRHNIGFLVLDALASKYGQPFSCDRFGSLSRIRIKGREMILLKPDTLMNLSGKAIAFWMDKEKIDLEYLLVIVDDLYLPFGVFRIKSKGSDGGHNGLKHIQEILKSTQYPRFRFGVGGDFSKGKQVDYVLGQWTFLQKKYLPNLLEKSSLAVEHFVLSGLSNTMTSFNGSHICVENSPEG